MRKQCIYCGSSFVPARSDQIYCSSSCRQKGHHKGELILPIKRKWFDMILQGVKKEEYREIKPYWEKRFVAYFGRIYDFQGSEPHWKWIDQPKYVVFRNGYKKDSPQFTAECTIREGTGCEEWGAVKGVSYYVLTVHRILDVKNLDTCNE